MPLIRAIGRFIRRRMDVDPAGYQTDTAGSMQNATEIGFLFIVILFLPLIALLVLIGLLYEGVIRIPGSHKLPSALHWALAGAIGTLVGAIVVVLAYNWLFPPHI
ncbi:MAG: hypothetical protein QFC55_01885 [Chloroflexota bacterium]|nr:hypothetical protein [Chloroflexota bacterium]